MKQTPQNSLFLKNLIKYSKSFKNLIKNHQIFSNLDDKNVKITRAFLLKITLTNKLSQVAKKFPRISVDCLKISMRGMIKELTMTTRRMERKQLPYVQKLPWSFFLCRHLRQMVSLFICLFSPSNCNLSSLFLTVFVLLCCADITVSKFSSEERFFSVFILNEYHPANCCIVKMFVEFLMNIIC